MVPCPTILTSTVSPKSVARSNSRRSSRGVSASGRQTLDSTNSDLAGKVLVVLRSRVRSAKLTRFRAASRVALFTLHIVAFNVVLLQQTTFAFSRLPTVRVVT